MLSYRVQYNAFVNLTLKQKKGITILPLCLLNRRGCKIFLFPSFCRNFKLLA
jgi:hypothetical protein